MMASSEQSRSDTRQHSRARVTANYTAAFADPIRIKTGDILRVEQRESEWPGWIWCITVSGMAGWVPEDYIRRTGDTAEALRDYDATELTVQIGDELELLYEQSGWYFSRTRAGDEGWVPAENLELLPR